MRATLLNTFASIVVAAMPVSRVVADTNARPAAANIAAADGSFTAALYHHLSAVSGNLLFSPYSLRSALAMTYAGARGDTAAQMNDVIGLDRRSPVEVAAAFSALDRSLDQRQPGLQLSVANSLWGKAGLPFDPSFVKLLDEAFKAPLHRADFAAAPDAARGEVNQWVGEHTAGKITDLMPPGSINAGTLLVLANAVYFNGKWEEPFKQSATHNEPFHLDFTHVWWTPMMYQQRSLGYAEADGMQRVELPYRGNEFSMVLVVPTAIDGLPAVEKQLDADHLRQLTSDFKPRLVELRVPKLKLSAKLSLVGALSAMGMPEAFDRHVADFTGMIVPGTSAERLFIGEVFHEATATVDEEGTEAAAATGVGVMTATAMRPVRSRVIVTADRPFLLLIRHRTTGTILFMGRVRDPR